MELKYYLRGLGLGIAITAIVMGIASSKNKTMTNEEIIARAKQLGMTENTVLDEINHKDDEQDVDKTDDSTNANKTDDSGKTDIDENTKSDSANLPTDTDDSNTSQNPDSAENVANASDIVKNETSDVLGRNSQTGVRKTDSGVDAEAGDAESKTDSKDTEPKTDSPDTDTKTDNPDTDTKTDSPDTDNKTDSTETKPSGADTTSSDKPMVITIGRGDGSYAVSKKLADVGAIESAGDFDTYLCSNGYDKKIRTGTYTIPANASEEQMARIITGAE